MPFDQQIIEVGSGLAGKFFQSEIIDDEQIGADKAAQLAVEGVEINEILLKQSGAITNTEDITVFREHLLRSRASPNVAKATAAASLRPAKTQLM